MELNRAAKFEAKPRRHPGQHHLVLASDGVYGFMNFWLDWNSVLWRFVAFEFGEVG